MDPNNGEILAMASVPNYDPNDFIPSISHERYGEYRDNPAVPLINRSISNFAPGSTFKLPAAIAGCKHNMHRSSCNCIGYTPYGNTKIDCWLKTGHGTLTLAPAIQRSCNPYFMNIADKIGYRKMVETYQMLGLGRQSGIRLPGENSGIVPGSSRWKKRNPEKHELDLLQEGIKEEHLETIRYGMRLAANVTGGTARRAKPDVENIIVGAKTGTAQTTDLGIKTHVAWTAAFAPYEHPRYVVVVAVKRGGSGGKVAGPLVKLILESIFALEKGQTVKLQKTEPYAGHLELIEETIIPEDLGSASFFEDGETGDEASEVQIIKPKRNPNDTSTPGVGSDQSSETGTPRVITPQRDPNE